MTDPYRIDLERFSLERLKQIFETREVLPACQVLKEDIEEHFQVLASMGITNVAGRIAAHKTKPTIEALARESGLPGHYLLILGCQARSYTPGLAYPRDIPRLNCEQVTALAAVGIEHSKHLPAGTP